MATTDEIDAPATTRERLWEREAPRLALFAPVLLGLGVWAYFARSTEPSELTALTAALGAGCALLGAALSAAFLPQRATARLLALALFLLLAGFALAALRTLSVAAPVIGPDNAPRQLEGVVVEIDRSASGRARLTLEALSIDGLAPQETPRRARVTLDGPVDAAARALLWRRVALSARLGPPFGPIEPGGFDPRFDAWFAQLGAIGLAETPPRDLGPGAPADLLREARRALALLRARIAERAREAAPGAPGAFAAALLVGDRSALPEDRVEDLRTANLSHLLAISGLHMGLASLTVFAALRLILALSESGGGRFEPKKLAALGAVIAGAAYLALSGGSIATWRAFAMAAVAFGAVLADRPAVTLRAVALAAILILAVAPESLFDIGFQLSFAATIAMVAAFEASRPIWRARRGAGGGTRRRLARAALLWALALLVSSLIAGLATAPFAAAAFNRSAPYGLLANVLAMPIMGFWIMPSGVLALALAPLGLDGLALAAMASGLERVLEIARFVAALPGAERAVIAPPPLAPALIALGGLWLALWRTGWLRLLGLAPVALAALVWMEAERPDLLIAPGGALVGLMTEEGRALDRARGQAYAAERWLRADGDVADQEAAAARGGWREARGGREAALGDLRLRLVLWRRLRPSDAMRLCDGPTLVIAPRAEADAGPSEDAIGATDAARPAPRDAPQQAAALVSEFGKDCLLLDRARLAETGAIAAVLENGRVSLRTAASEAGRRFWTDPALRRALLESAPAQQAP